MNIVKKEVHILMTTFNLGNLGNLGIRSTLSRI
nr:MAG TPA: hypothetical protein [Caudoviricetes sp.]